MYLQATGDVLTYVKHQPVSVREYIWGVCLCGLISGTGAVNWSWLVMHESVAPASCD